MKPSLLGLTEEALAARLTARGHKAYRAKQIMEWLWKARVRSLAEMTNLPPALRDELAAEFSILPLKVVEVNASPGGTRKFLSRLEDGHLIESVIIPAAEDMSGKKADRVTLCVSSQVGCAFGCRFCASGLHGLTRNLAAAEILGQILAAEEIAGRRVDNLVFMGMGEPLANCANLLPALDLIMAHTALGIGARHITISTSGNVPGLKKLAAYGKPIRLAVSLHGASDAVRSRVMPVNDTWPLGELLPVLETWAGEKKHMITLEYILIEGVNADFDEARRLAGIARRLNAKVNLIPYNAVDGLPWKRPLEEHCKAFCRILVRERIPVTMRYEKGGDINAACGQLRLRKLGENGASPKAAPPVE